MGEKYENKQNITLFPNSVLAEIPVWYNEAAEILLRAGGNSHAETDRCG
jgi:hypothetical protein